VPKDRVKSIFASDSALRKTQTPASSCRKIEMEPHGSELEAGKCRNESLAM
jgi:hypothetical protein